MKKNKWRILYEIIMALLALVVAVILYIDYTCSLSPAQQETVYRVDLIILIIFAADYFTRLYLADNKREFFKKNIPDLIAIIPLDMVFRVARLARLTRLFRLLRISALLTKRLIIPLGILKTNGLYRILIVALASVIMGAVGILAVEPKINNLGDALWWSIVTTTTVGYGDISPSSDAGRVIAVMLMFVGIGTLGMLTGSIATYFIKDGGEKEDGIKSIIHERIDNLEKLDEREFEELMSLIKLKRSKSKKVNPDNCDEKGFRMDL